ncbi:receptor-like protein 7 [Pyrus communis]|uniref:receptor-like protein 7 n=1 Tax=Pyrus communis TaxID=23211 RepID=UPI0035C15D96
MGMESRRSKFISVRCFTLLLIIASQFSLSVQTQTICHDDERSALLQFNDSFTIDESASTLPFAYPKVASWTLEGDAQNQTSDCCSWDGVECDEVSGHVIGLDLRSSCLYGSLNSSSSLFQLVHLQSLDLSDNNFNFSQIPSRLGHDLASLTYLNLSKSFFSGEIPSEISMLSKLSTLDLSTSQKFHDDNNILKLTKTNLISLVQNMTKNIEQLHLDLVDIYSTLPDGLVNASSLISLRLAQCGLYGEFPVGVFHLPSLQVLYLFENYDLTGYFPNFNKTNSIKRLDVSLTKFYGQLPSSLGNLHSLNELRLSQCTFCPCLPSSLRNLTQLTYLDISQFYDSTKNFCTNQLASCPWFWVGKLTNLFFLGLDDAIRGEFPDFLANLTQLSYLSMGSNEMTGPIPSWLMNLSQLSYLDLSQNKLQGEIPQSFFRLRDLQFLDLSDNNLSGLVEVDQLSKLKSLKKLFLSYNKLSLNFKTNMSAAFPKLQSLRLDSCNLTEFPGFLHDQYELTTLYLSNNNIRGQIPKWLWNATRETMLNLNLENNFLTGFEQDPGTFPWQNLRYLFLDFNKLQGSLPIPPQSIRIYYVANNCYSGEVSPSFCNLNDLHTLDLSNNNLSGKLPQCLGNSSNLGKLSLRNNSFHGGLPSLCPTVNSSLASVDLSYNQLGGKLPRSIANCTQLVFLNIANNHISDIFPSWLGALPVLWALILRSNGFHGVIGNPATTHEFPKLCIIDLSNNDFSGILPSNYFENWNSMKFVGKSKHTYFETFSSIDSQGFVTHFRSVFPLTIFGKGVELKYEETPNLLKLIDLSGNKFDGEIPAGVIGNLRGLVLLNLSNNGLTGQIPSSLGNLNMLESLDLSHNQLSGRIPSNLAQLTFLAYWDVSHNLLWGPIPVGKQFDTFENDSYEGNSGLCGKPLSRKCEAPPPPSAVEEDEDSGFEIGLDWYVVLPGVVSGLIVGVVAGNTLANKKREWFVEKFSRRRQPRRTRRRRG